MTTSGRTGNRSPAAIWGAMLKYYREKAGLTQTRLADQIGYSASHIGSVETGRRTALEDLARRSDEATGAEGALIIFHEKLLADTGFMPGLDEWVRYEGEAAIVRGFDSALIPGLFQTREYAEAILELDGEEAVTARLARQAVFDKDDPPVVRFIVSEWALRHMVGNAGIMYRQLERLEHVITSGLAHLQVIPSNVLPGTNGHFALATGNGRTIGYEESILQGRVLVNDEDLHPLEIVYDRLLAEALTPARSLELIRELKDELWTS